VRADLVGDEYLVEIEAEAFVHDTTGRVMHGETGKGGGP